MIKVHRRFWLLEISYQYRQRMETTGEDDIRDFLRHKFNTEIYVTTHNTTTYSIQFSNSKYETIFQLMYPEYILDIAYDDPLQLLG